MLGYTVLGAMLFKTMCFTTEKPVQNKKIEFFSKMIKKTPDPVRYY